MSVTTIVMFIVLAQADSWRPTLGQVDARFRHGPRILQGGTRQKGFVFTTCLHNNGWIVGRIQLTEITGSHRAPQKITISDERLYGASTALIAVNPTSRKVVQFAPFADKPSGSVRRSISSFFRVSDHSCGVVILRSTFDASNAILGQSEELWDWRIEQNEARKLGDWGDVHMLAFVLDSTSVVVSSSSANGKSIVKLQSKSNGRETSLTLNSPIFVEPDGGLPNDDQETLVGISDRMGVVVVGPNSATPATVTCVDPARPGGNRWKFDAPTGSAQLGFEIERISAIRTGTINCKWIPLLLQGIDKTTKGSRASLVSLNPVDGAICQRVSLASRPSTIVVSPKVGFAAFTADEGNDKDGDVLNLLETATGKALAKLKRWDYGDVYPFAIDDSGITFAGDTTSIWKISVDGRSVVKVFQLDPRPN